jgi:hypothetical protein
MDTITNATVRTDLPVTEPLTPERTSALAPAGSAGKSQDASIRISAGGRSLASAAASRNKAANAAIENSNLPDQVKKLLVRIRELQEKLREKAEELARIAAQQNMDPRQRTMKVAAL